MRRLPFFKLVVACVVLASVVSVFGQVSNGAGIPTPEAIEQEVLANVRQQSVGHQIVEDLNLPEPFLRRVADQVIRTTYEQRYRIVVPNPTSLPAAGATGVTPAARAPFAAPTPKVARWTPPFVIVIVLIAVLRRRRRNKGAGK